MCLNILLWCCFVWFMVNSHVYLCRTAWQHCTMLLSWSWILWWKCFWRIVNATLTWRHMWANFLARTEHKSIMLAYRFTLCVCCSFKDLHASLFQNGDTALHFVVNGGESSVVQCFVRCGADLNARNLVRWLAFNTNQLSMCLRVDIVITNVDIIVFTHCMHENVFEYFANLPHAFSYIT